MFWLWAIGLATATALILIWPVMRGGAARRQGGADRRSDAVMAIFRDQLAEIDRDLARGVIAQPEAQAARLEIKRRVLAADKSAPKGDGGTASGRDDGVGLLVALALVVPLCSVALYTQLGAPDVPSVPFAQRTQEQNEARDLQRLTAKLRLKLEEDANGGENRGWELLAATYMKMGRYRDAAYAFSKLVGRKEATSATWSQYAESLIAAEQGMVSPKASEALAKAHELDPKNPAATYYQAQARAQAGQTRAARQMLLDRIEAEGTMAPWMQSFLQQANQWGNELGLTPVDLAQFELSGPSGDDMAAAAQMSPEEREAFIRNMVEGLAARLEDEPDNLAGWLRLARAYMVLQEPGKARAALEQAEPLTRGLERDDPRRQMVEQGLEELKN